MTVLRGRAKAGASHAASQNMLKAQRQLKRMSELRDLTVYVWE